ncbi:MAG: MmcQ/YjbR family DNA-binding protein [Melioribacteraceae bacterium]|nr:MmcQ/YjbR family DNA-binding protein [Melioribacteraceae bacterium]
MRKKGVTESLPFDDETLVFKVMSKMFCLGSINMPYSINLKCDPELAAELREQHEEITPGYHMNKKHWNSVNLQGRLKPLFIKELIDHSYGLVIKSLGRKERDELEKMKSE